MAEKPSAPPEEDEVTWREDVSDLLGFDFGAAGDVDRSGLRALINSALVSHRRLPMLDVIFDRTARLMTTSLRHLTDDNVEVSLDDVSSLRFGDFVQSMTLPAVVGVVRMAPLANYCLVAADSALVFSIVDILLGGRRGGNSLAVEERNLTAIELGLAQRILSLLVEDLQQAFKPAADGAFSLERVETTARFAAIAQEASVCALAKFRVSVEGCGGRACILIPHAALDPIKASLAREFIGEQNGADGAWLRHLNREVAAAEVELSVVLAEKTVTIGALKELQAGETIVFSRTNGAAEIRSGGRLVAKGRVGRSGDSVAVRLDAGVVDKAEAA
jgi:flagellar motor switch protein FliM